MFTWSAGAEGRRRRQGGGGAVWRQGACGPEGQRLTTSSCGLALLESPHLIFNVLFESRVILLVIFQGDPGEPGVNGEKVRRVHAQTHTRTHARTHALTHTHRHTQLPWCLPIRTLSLIFCSSSRCPPWSLRFRA